MLMLVLVGVPLISGFYTMYGIPRFSVVVFPFFILLSKLSNDILRDKIITPLLLFVQVFFMACWVNGALII
jgi:hypothetical protein